MKDRPLQYFSDEYLQSCKELSPKEILEFLDNFRIMHGPRQSNGKSKLISIKVPEALLETFRKKAELEGIAYQTQIKKLMLEWLSS